MCVLLELLLLALLLTGLTLIVAGRFQLLAFRRRARDRAHILKRVADLEDHRR